MPPIVCFAIAISPRPRDDYSRKTSIMKMTSKLAIITLAGAVSISALATRALAQESEGNKVTENPKSDPRISLAIGRTGFARFRTSLALDRTTLAWIRTATTFAAFGFGMIGFFRSLRISAQTEQAARLHQAAIRVGVALIVIGLGATILVAISHWFTLPNCAAERNSSYRNSLCPSPSPCSFPSTDSTHFFGPSYTSEG